MKWKIEMSVLASSQKINTPAARKTFAFENLYALVKSIKFSKRRNEFQSNLINNVKQKSTSPII